ncbi:MAG TPA: UV DNA damage repair endonuclease UvsE [Kouleothrix sp.]|uniref:UV DNA damage repair endonuclease UvsE n=1 Tax=Kouleothrix sp. TaxID=2779161 RepID=UPI002C355EC9|nr:UV DNA damage repair endonuclease UvsE [Kouleothrix sp.]HRC76944.1 UV DNA damage repair endonuclease UvsE [Kouleothrix sp.]
MRLGFAVKVLGQPGLPSNDARRWQSAPHLRVSLGYLEAIFAYLGAMGITMYRISSDIAPYLTHPDLPQFHGQLDECAADLARLGQAASAQGLRLSFHPSQYILLNSPDDDLVNKSMRDLDAQARMLDAMGQGPEAVVVTHVGGVYGDLAAGRERWVRAYARLPEPARRRLVLENDDTRYGVDDILWIHERSGVRLVFDYLHHWCVNRAGLDQHEALRMCLATWPAGVTPKIHYSSPRTEQRTLERKNRHTGKTELVQARPVWSGHSDYINPFEFISFLRGAAGARDFDIMLESKLKDLALLQLRDDLRRYAPELPATR